MNSHQKVYNYLNTKLWFLILCFIFVACNLPRCNAIACESCGRECASACGTKHFRTCCFNYLRKRSDPLFSKSYTPSISSSSSGSISELDNTPGFIINSIPDEPLYDPSFRVLEQILDDIRHDSKSLENEVRKALNTRKAEYAEKKHRLHEQQLQQPQQQVQQQNLQQKELDY